MYCKHVRGATLHTVHGCMQFHKHEYITFVCLFDYDCIQIVVLFIIQIKCLFVCFQDIISKYINIVTEEETKTFKMPFSQ